MKRYKIVSSVVFVYIVLLFTGCSKNTIIFEDGWENPNSNNPDGKALVTFNAAVEDRNLLTRAMAPMKKGIQNQLYAFTSTNGGEAKGIPYAEGLYITSAPGVLTGNDGYKMYLESGIYDFYAVSDNFSTIPPKFTSGQSEPLFNGIDYLWWHSPEQDIMSNQVNIPILYLHAATQVVFEVSGGSGINLNKLVSAMITPPETGARMNLYTGIIPPASIYDKADKMGINGLLAQYIMLPLKTTSPMSLTLEVMVNNESTSRIYSVNVPVPNGELQSGDSYLFNAIIDENSVDFSQVSIKNWTEVDETGKPLYPTLK
ncbi:fimbrillin family protein [Parabacteroides provencensis]|uniref:fimbrillin family protein n=1 Tax=Parabacteroides provencensis TaxID=1944636 RepID=UPI000C14CC1B|nr:fimbrillin family protein [Parabacteroides provencensis]